MLRRFGSLLGVAARSHAADELAACSRPGLACAPWSRGGAARASSSAAVLDTDASSSGAELPALTPHQVKRMQLLLKSREVAASKRER